MPQHRTRAKGSASDEAQRGSGEAQRSPCRAMSRRHVTAPCHGQPAPGVWTSATRTCPVRDAGRDRLVGGRGGEHEQVRRCGRRACRRSTAGRSRRSSSDLAALGDPEARRLERVGDPDAPSASRQMPSGGRGRELGPDAAVRAACRRADVERGEPRAERLGDDQRAAVGRDDRAVREARSSAATRDRAVGRDAGELAVVVAARPASRRARRRGRSRSCRRRRGRAPSTTMSLQWHGARSRDRSACSTSVPSGSSRSSRRSSIDTTSSRPSGSQPSPEGWSGTSTTRPRTSPSHVDATSPRGRRSRRTTAGRRASAALRRSTALRPTPLPLPRRPPFARAGHATRGRGTVRPCPIASSAVPACASTSCLGAMMFGRIGNPDHAAAPGSSTPRSTPASTSSTPPTSTRSASRRRSWAALSSGRRDAVVLATKFHNGMGDDPNMRGTLRRRWIVRACEDSLRRLRTDRIDLYQVHRPDPTTDLDETLGALSDLVHQGKIRAWARRRSRPDLSSRCSGPPSGGAT